MVAGQLIEEVSGQTWEVFVRDHVFKPAGMTSSTTDRRRARFATPNRAQPHARTERRACAASATQQVLDERETLGAQRRAGRRPVVERERHGSLAGNPARRTARCPDDGKARLFSEDASREMWTPQVLMPDQSPYPARIAEATPQFSAYALGWDVRDYRGVKLIEHGGAVFGVQTIVVLIPGPTRRLLDADQFGGRVGPARTAVRTARPLPGRAETRLGGRVSRNSGKPRSRGGLAALDATKESKKPSRPSLAPLGYAGNYADPWYGPIDVTPRQGRPLRIDFKQTPDMAGTLEHWQYDTFRTSGTIAPSSRPT